MNTYQLPLALGMPGGSELILILVLILVFFGGKRLPEMARSLGTGIKEFKKSMREVGDDVQTVANGAGATPSTKPASNIGTVRAENETGSAAEQRITEGVAG